VVISIIKGFRTIYIKIAVKCPIDDLWGNRKAEMMPTLDLSGLTEVIVWMFVLTAPYAVLTNMLDMLVTATLKMMFGKGKWFVN